MSTPALRPLTGQLSANKFKLVQIAKFGPEVAACTKRKQEDTVVLRRWPTERPLSNPEYPVETVDLDLW